MDNETKESVEPKTAIPVSLILSLALAVLLAVIFFKKYGIWGAIGGFVLGISPIVGPATLLYITFWG